MGTRRMPPPGLDYVPVSGDDPNLVFGVIRTTLAGVPNSASKLVFRRLFPVAKPEDLEQPWPEPTCFRPDVLLPDWAPADYAKPQALCRAYDAQAWEGMKDLAIILNFRFPETLGVDGGPPTLGLSGVFELVRAFCYQKLTKERGLATVLAMHVPSRAGIDFSPPHVHAIALARTVVGQAGFGPFIPDLARDAGRQILEQEWREWRNVAPEPIPKKKRAK